MAKSGTTILMQPGLCRSDDISSILNRAGAEQYVPMRLACRNGKGRWNGEQLSAAVAERGVKCGKPEIITN